MTRITDYDDDRMCYLLEVIGFFQVEQDRAEKIRLRAKYKCLVRRHPGKYIAPPDLYMLREPEQWKEV